MPLKPKRTALVVCIVLMASAVAPSLAQPTPPKNGSTPVGPVVPFVDSGTVTPRQLHIYDSATPKVCFWQDKSGGTAFGNSGFCPAASAAAIGSPCRCSSNTTGRPNGKWVGKVMLAPSPTGSTDVVR